MNQQPIITNIVNFSPHETKLANFALPDYDIFIAYDVVPAGHRAMNLMQEITQELDQTFEIKPHLWRLDLLDFPEWFEVAAAEASKSTLMIISTWSEDELSPAVRRLLKSCVTPAKGGDTTVIGLIGPDNSSEEADGMNFKFIMSTTGSVEEDFRKRDGVAAVQHGKGLYEKTFLEPELASFQNSKGYYD